MRVYADGSALLRYLPGVPQSDDWRAWAARRAPDLLISSLSASELRAAAAMQPPDVRARAHDVIDRIDEVRYFDQAIKVASMTTGVLSPFGALHLGIAVAHPDIEEITTYDLRLAQVAAMHSLVVVSPGLPNRWWQSVT